MAEENIDIAKFNFNIDDVLRSATLLKKEIDTLKESQKQLRDDGKASSVQYVQQEASLKSLNTEYRRHIKAMVDTSKQAQDTAVREKLLDNVLGQEVSTIKEAREQNKLLNKLRNDTNVTTQEGQETLDALNGQLDRNNQLIKNNVDQYTAQKINIGNYKNDVMEALSAQNLLANGTSGLKAAFTAAAQGVVAFTRASLAFIATPIGAVIAALAAAFLLVKNALNRNEESMNKLSRAFAPFSGMIDAILSSLEPLGEFLIDTLVVAFDKVEEGVNATIESLSSVLDFLGFEDAAKSVADYSDSLQAGAENAKQLADAEAEMTKSQREARLTLLEYQKQAESFRQVRDDESKSISERIAANEALGMVLEQQLQDELRIAKQALIVAQLRIQAEGQTKEALDAQADALTEIADIEERINGQRSEQLVNRVALEKEAEEKRQKAIDDRLKKQKEEIDLFIAEQGIRARTLAQELELERDISKKKEDLLKQELKNKRISQEQYQTEILNMKNELALKEAELLADNALRELEQEREKNAKIQEQDGFLSAAKAQARIDAQQAQFEQEKAFAQLQLESGLINQQEFDDSINELKETNRLAQEDIRKQREEAEKAENLELQALEFEEKMARLEEEKASQFEIESAIIEEQRRASMESLEADREAGLISKRMYEARLAQIDRQAKEGERQRDKILAEQKIDLMSAAFNAAASIVDRNSAAGKAIAVAQAGINTFQGVTGAMAATPGPVGIAMGAIVGALGAVQIAKILSTEVPSASGSGTAAGSSGSGASAAASGIGGVNLSGRSLNPAQASASSSAVVQQQIDAQTGRSLNEGVRDAVAEGAREGTQRGSNEGITNLSANRQIAVESTF